MKGKYIDSVGTDNKAVYGYSCDTIVPPINNQARLIDNIAGFPVYGQPRDCCNGTADEFFEIDCFPPTGVSKHVKLLLIVQEVTGQYQGCGVPICSPVILEYGGGSWSGPSVSFPGGDISFTLSCQPLADPSERWKLSATGCAEFDILGSGGLDACGAFIHGDGFYAMDPSICCNCPPIDLHISVFVNGFIGRGYRMGRLIDWQGMPVYATTRCCEEEVTTNAPDCCDRIPCSISGEVISSCGTINGTLELNYTPVPIGVTGRQWNGSVTLPGGKVLSVGFICHGATAPVLEEDLCFGEITEDVICPADGYAQCDKRSFLGATFLGGVQCGDASWSGRGDCGTCDCDPLDMTIGLTLNGIGDCDCEAESISLRVTNSMLMLAAPTLPSPKSTKSTKPTKPQQPKPKAKSGGCGCNSRKKINKYGQL